MNESPYFVAFYNDMKARRLIREFMLKIRKILKLTDSGERVLGVCSTIVGCKKFLTHCFATRTLSLGEGKVGEKNAASLFCVFLPLCLSPFPVARSE
tara:strand:+ start:343 stop:633 length:291 start_codon:yes stop_codon:yes gene_type:complete